MFKIIQKKHFFKRIKSFFPSNEITEVKDVEWVPVTLEKDI